MPAHLCLMKSVHPAHIPYEKSFPHSLTAVNFTIFVQGLSGDLQFCHYCLTASIQMYTDIFMNI